MYRDPAGNYLLKVREEERKGVEGVMLVGVSQRNVYTRFYPLNTAIPAELVNDTEGRAEAEVERRYAGQVEHERDALAECMKLAVSKLPANSAEELRALFKKRRKEYSL